MIIVANPGKTADRKRLPLEEPRRTGLNLRKDHSLLDSVENKPYPSREGGIDINLAPNEYKFLIIQ